MPTDYDRIREFLYHSALFADFEDTELDELAGQVRFVFPENETPIYSRGEPGDRFFLVFRGAVRLVDTSGSYERDVAVLEAGDYFGQEGVISSTATYEATALPDEDFVALIEITRPRFDQLTKQHPQIRRTLKMVLEPKSDLDRKHFPWLGVNETIYFVARRHWLILFLRMLPPFVFLLLALVALWLGSSTEMNLFTMSGGLLLFVAAVWALWVFLDWRNDYYILTDQRVVWVEEVIALYDTRQEAPLHTILTTDTQSSQFGRWFGYGDVRVKTFTGVITFYTIANPQNVIDMINELRERHALVKKSEDHAAIKHTVRTSIGLERRPPAPPPKRKWRKQPEKKIKTHSFLRDFLRMRLEEGSYITYRKHWIVLLYQTFLPTVFIALSILSYRLLHSLLVVIGLVIVFLTWWLYQYFDWHNDIFQVSDDKIFDIDKKPLGTEQRKEAPIDNILSMEVERIGLIGLVFNFGNVNIDVGGALFVFDNIYNPAYAQQDIFRRIDVRRNRKQKDQDEKERQRLAEWFGIYDEEARNPYNYEEDEY